MTPGLITYPATVRQLYQVNFEITGVVLTEKNNVLPLLSVTRVSSPGSLIQLMTEEIDLY